MSPSPVNPGQVEEALREARRRTLLHVAGKRAPVVRELDMPRAEVFKAAPPTASEERHAEPQPTGAAALWLALALAVVLFAALLFAALSYVAGK